MLSITLTYRHAAAPCPTPTGRTGETVVGGRKDTILPPPFCKLNSKPMLPFRCRRKAVSGAFAAAESHAPSQPMLRVHTNIYHSQ